MNLSLLRVYVTVKHGIFIWCQEIIKYLGYFLREIREGPGKNIHKIRKHVRMGAVVILLDVEGAVLEFDHSSFIVVNITVIRGTENSDDCREIA